MVEGGLEGAYIVSAAKFIAAGVCMGIGVIGPALGQGFIAGKACESIGHRPESAKAINASLFPSLVFVETSSLFAFVIAILLVFFAR